MSTRRERWLKYRAKCQRRKLHQRSRGWAWESPGHGTGAGGARRRLYKKWDHEFRGEMPPCFVSDALKEHGPPLFIGSFFFTLNVTPAAQGVPPIPFITGGILPYVPVPDHYSDALHGYHRRRVQAWGRKSTAKMDGITRRLWFEAVFQMNNGYYRDVDPKGRHPNETDVNNGVPPDPFPTWKGI